MQYEGSKDFEAQVIVRIQSGNPPDIAIFPQPGLLADRQRHGFGEAAPED